MLLLVAKPYFGCMHAKLHMENKLDGLKSIECLEVEQTAPAACHWLGLHAELHDDIRTNAPYKY